MEHPTGERGAYLEQVTAEDAELRREVGQLIDGIEATGPGPAIAGDRLVGTRLGPYDIVRLIGRGGMGAVYEAVRADDSYKKRVAIKLVPGELHSELTLARFRRERQILATLQHPHIATLLDGGVAPDGRPFLVMEYIEGEPLTAWCDAHHRSIRERIALVRQICDAVQHAHTNLIVHGDIKPGNILVTADGTSKLLDFGIAKLVGVDVGDQSMPLTRGGARPFTPEYASPEQIRGAPLTTASDIYSLGVVLFELCTGRRPDHQASDTPVPKPSSVVSDPRVRRRLVGELDNIMLKALRPEPERRYASVTALSEDLRRHLVGLPVEAQSDWAGYRLRKFVIRNRVVVAASVLLLLVILGGALTTAIQARRARSAQIRAERVNDFLRNVLSSVRPATGGRDVPVSEVLDSAARRIDVELAAQPDVRSDLETVIGQSYSSLARYDEAERHLKVALALDQQLNGPRSIPVVLVLNDLGQLGLLSGQLDRADTAFQQALAIRRSLSVKPDTILAMLVDGAGSVAHDKGKFADAERLHRQALDLYRSLLGDHADKVALTMGNVAVSLGEQNRWDSAETMHRSALAILQANHPEPNTMVADAKDGLATALDIQGKTAASESTYLDALALRKKLLGPEHPKYTWTLFNYSFLVFGQGRYQEAADISRQILALRGKTIPDSHPSIAASLQTLGRCEDQLGDTASGRRSLEESLALRRKFLPPDSWLIGSSEGVLADHDVIVKQYGKAETLSLDAYAIMTKSLGADHPKTQTAVQRLVGLYTAWGRPQKAAEFRSKLTAPHA
jgi:tetratricopeptide (TPR) repeat protein/tRNA A-37 threonylcarbamoyl transferase component Bud32